MDPQYVLISTQINWACGPTLVGDADSEPELMSYLNATKISRLGNNFSEYSTDWAPPKVLNMLAKRGYRVVGIAGVGQTCIWTLFKDTSTQAEIHHTQ
uniref:GTP cyclohydrolase 1 feedback regulatory protein n=1 Tax=Acrobeloides nanus TaxID=290746 RepID=A0A914D1D2_9BILA